MPLTRQAWDVCVTLLPETPDGWAEVTLEVNGRLVWTDVAAPGGDGALLVRRLVEQARRYC